MHVRYELGFVDDDKTRTILNSVKVHDRLFFNGLSEDTFVHYILVSHDASILIFTELTHLIESDK